jgi:molybdenum cofactor guanylyltransferase
MRLKADLGLVLAGGEGQRMGGGKVWRILDGKPLIAHMSALARPQVHELAIASNELAARFAAYSDLVLPDVPTPGLGPLGGIAAGLAALAAGKTSGWLAVFPVDMPGLPGDLIHRLLGAAQHHGTRGAYALSGANGHYLAALFHASLANEACDLAASSNRRVRALHQVASSVALQFGSAAARQFADLNTAEALGSAQLKQPKLR